MAAQLIRKVRDRQPQRPVKIGWSNPVTAGIKTAMRSLADPVIGYGAGTVSHHAASAVQVTAKGLGRKYTFSSYAANYSTFTNSPSSPKSCYMFQGIRGADSDAKYFATLGNAKFGVNTDGRLIIYYGATITFSTKTIAVGESFTVFIWGANLDQVSCDLNGEVTTYTDSSGWGGIDYIATVGGDLSYGSSNHTVISITGWNRYLLAAERESLRNNSWKIFEPETIPLFFSTVTAQYARPTSDVSAGGWTASSGTDLFAMIDEAVVDDADYITSSTASICEVALGSMSDPALSTGHIVRYRISATVGGIIVRLQEGTTTIASWTHNPAPSSLTTYAQTLSGSEADSITNYAALKLQFEAV